MSRTALGSLVLASALPVLLSATCNPKKGEGEGQTVFVVGGEPSAAGDAAGGGGAAAAAKGGAEFPDACPVPHGSSPPLGPLVGPACPAGRSQAGEDLSAEVSSIAGTRAAGMVAVGSLMEALAGEDPVVVGSAVLQGPPHCYEIIASCEGGAAPTISIAAERSASGLPHSSASAPGPSMQFCPDRTDEFAVAVSTGSGDHRCALGIFGD